MRRWTWLLLALLLTACGREEERPAPVPAPLEWYLEHGMEPWAPGDCPYPVPSLDPTLAGVTVYGLYPHSWWHPGDPKFLNLRAEQSPSLLVLSLQPVGEERPVYRLTMEEGPTYLQIPSVGCWELTVEADGRSESLVLPVRPDRPAFLGAEHPTSNGPVPLPGTSRRLPELLDLIASGEDRPAPPSDQRPINLSLQWENWGSSAVDYYRGSDGRPAVIGLAKSLVSGNCAEDGMVYRTLPTDLSELIDQDLTGVRSMMAGHSLPISGCLTFTLSRP